MDPARSATHRPAQLSHDYSLFASADATAPRVCRDFVRAILYTHGRESFVMAAALCTSELVTNVHLHTKGAAILRVRLDPARLHVSVFDESPDLPVLVRPATSAPTCRGRGLALVAETADGWGVADRMADRYAKGVWFELGLGG
jgi:anti-sigma regulatory factor (Ser/Thr protein kinase)